MAWIGLVKTDVGITSLRLRWASNPTSSYSDSELKEEAFPLDTFMGGLSMMFKGDSCLETENKVN